MSESTERVLKELDRFVTQTPGRDLYKPAVVLEYLREMVGQAEERFPDDFNDSNPLLPIGIALERIKLEAEHTRGVGTFVAACAAGIEAGTTVSLALLKQPEWMVELGAAATLITMALTQPGLNWKVNRRIRGSLENLLTIARFAGLVGSLQPASSQGNVPYEPSGEIPASGL